MKCVEVQWGFNFRVRNGLVSFAKFVEITHLHGFKTRLDFHTMPEWNDGFTAYFRNWKVAYLNSAELVSVVSSHCQKWFFAYEKVIG